MTTVHQCPRCELRFADEWELKDHIDEAHPHPADDDTLTDEERRKK